MPILILAALVLLLVPLLVLPSPWNLIGFAAGLLLSIVGLLAGNRTVRHRRKQVGAGTLIGRTAVVVSPCRPNGQVRLDGEIWAARADPEAMVGDSVRIIGRDRLTLLVQPVPDGDR